MVIKRISDVLKARFGEKVYKLSLSTGCTCPNRDGTAGYEGCTFCSAGGSGEYAAHHAPVDVQIEEARRLISSKTNASKFIAYFQSFSNTYGDTDELGQIFRETIAHDEIVILSIGTRPDCLPPEMIKVLSRLNRIKPVWVELGLQTIHERTAEAVKRGYPLSVFDDAYHRLKSAGLDVVVHLILGLPSETEEDMLESVGYVSGLSPAPDGIKLQMLQVLRGTAMAEQFVENPFRIMSLEEYGELLIKCLRMLPPETAIHRITGDGPRRLLIEPRWSLDKKHVLNTLNRMIKEAGG